MSFRQVRRCKMGVEMEGAVDKYDQAIEYLRELDAGQGSYLDEVACLIEELLGRVHELESAQLPPEPLTDWEIENKRQLAAAGRQLAERAARAYRKG